MLTRKILLLITIAAFDLYGQDTTASWLRNIDTPEFRIYYSKRKIPSDILKYMEVDNLKEIANPGKEYRAGCIGPASMPYMRLNWIAKDKKRHTVLSISTGGKGRRTCFYYLDYDKKKPNINELSFGHSFKEITALSFEETVEKIKNQDFDFEEYEEPDPPEDE